MYENSLAPPNFKIRRLQHWMLLATGKIQLVVVVWLQFWTSFSNSSWISNQPKYAAITKVAIMQQLIDFCQSGQIYWLSDKCPFKPKHLHKVCWSVIVHKICKKFLTSNQTAAFGPISLLLKISDTHEWGSAGENLLPREKLRKVPRSGYPF